MKISLSPVLILCASTSLIAPRCVAKDKEIFIAVGNLFSEGPTQPVKSLSAALKKNPQHKLFRVSWNSSASLIRDYAVLLYHRRNRTLKLYYEADGLVDEGNEGGPVIRNLSSESVLYKGVEDSMIHQLLSKYGKTNKSPEEILPALVRLGCRKQRLAFKSHNYTVK